MAGYARQTKACPQGWIGAYARLTCCRCMRALRIAAAVLSIVIATPAGSAGAQGVLEQMRGPSRFQESELPCKPFESTLEMRNAGPWSGLDIVPERAPPRADDAEAELRRLGGVRVVLKVDVVALRGQMIEEARQDIMRIARS